MRWSLAGGGRSAPGLMPLHDALDVLGEDGWMERRSDDVPLTSVVGSANRSHDFDHDFRLVNKSLEDRWNRLAGAVRAGVEPPPVTLIQLGELYFVMDGHHRVSVARKLGRDSIPARVQRVCTIAYAMCCLRLAHLPNKAAERRFLERVPLPEAVRNELWLDHPQHWTRLADAAEAWAFRRSRGTGRSIDRDELAGAWWAEEVVPVLERLRAAGAGTGVRDVQLYVTALAVRDRVGGTEWPDDLVARVNA